MGRRVWGGAYGAARMGRRAWGGAYGAARMGRRVWGGAYGAARMGRRVWGGANATCLGALGESSGRAGAHATCLGALTDGDPNDGHEKGHLKQRAMAKSRQELWRHSSAPCRSAPPPPAYTRRGPAYRLTPLPQPHVPQLAKAKAKRKHSRHPLHLPGTISPSRFSSERRAR